MPYKTIRVFRYKPCKWVKYDSLVSFLNFVLKPLQRGNNMWAYFDVPIKGKTIPTERFAEGKYVNLNESKYWSKILLAYENGDRAALIELIKSFLEFLKPYGNGRFRSDDKNVQIIEAFKKGIYSLKLYEKRNGLKWIEPKEEKIDEVEKIKETKKPKGLEKLKKFFSWFKKLTSSDSKNCKV